MRSPLRVLVAGIGGASLGTELYKCLSLAGGYELFGCDISPLAYGHYERGFARTYVVDPDEYVSSVLRVCSEEGIPYLVPGGEQPMRLLAASAAEVRAAGVSLVMNDPAIIADFSDKRTTFQRLGALGFNIPLTCEVQSEDEVASFSYPCIVKPSSDSGGSSFVFLARDRDEASLYVDYLRRNGRRALLQEYVPVDEGEFTIGVLSLPDGALVGSIALRRSFDAKLSVQQKGATGLISSGYSQGYIGAFPELQTTAERIASAIGSRGPINIQARVRNGELIPFEINPRFSASTYLRAMAGFNEVDIFIRHLAGNAQSSIGEVRPGYYLRSLTETYVPAAEVQE